MLTYKTKLFGIATALALCLAAPVAIACEKLDRIQNSVDRDLAQRTGEQSVEFPLLKDGSSFSMRLTYRDEAGAPRSVMSLDGPLILMPRQYFLDVVAWVDAFVVCAVDSESCGPMAEFAEAFRTGLPRRSVPFLPSLVDEPASACAVRDLPQYGKTVSVALNTTMLMVQAHEIAHGVFGHLNDPERKIGKLEEAHADAFAKRLVEYGEVPDFVEGNWAALALLPLMRRVYESDAHPNLACRVHFLSNGVIDIRGDNVDCSEYLATVGEGLAMTDALIGPDTEMRVTP